MVFEGLEISTASFVFPEIVRDWHVAMDQITVIVTAGVIGMAAGAATAGWFAVRFGCKVTVMVGFVLFGATTVAMAMTSSYELFAALRVMACLGLGAASPTVIALVADSVPSHRRAQLTTLTFSGVAAGVIAAGALASTIIPALGWEAFLLISGIGSIVYVPVISAAIPEPPADLIARGEPEHKARRSLELLAPDCDLSGVEYLKASQDDDVRAGSPLAGIFSRSMAGSTLLLWLMFFSAVGAAFLLGNYLPLMAKSEGFTAAQGGMLVAALGWGGLVGQASVSYTLKRFDGFKVLVLLWSVGLVGVVSVSAVSLSFGVFTLVAVGLGLTVSSSTAALNGLSTTVYPPSVRATGVAWASAAGRVGTLVTGLVGGAMLAAGWSRNDILASLAVPFAVGILAALTLRAVLRRRRVQDTGATTLGGTEISVPAAE